MGKGAIIAAGHCCLDIFPAFADSDGALIPVRLIDGIDGALLEHLVDQLFSFGAAIVAVKLGDHGLYLGTTADMSRWEALSSLIPAVAGPRSATRLDVYVGDRSVAWASR